MSKIFTSQQLYNRNNIIQSQKLLHNFLTADTINVLINLFDEDVINNINKDKIKQYIEEERKHQGLSDTNVKIKTEYYGLSKKETALHLGIIKNNKDFIHLTIHLVPKTFEPGQTGIIHIKKDVYKKQLSKTKKKYSYSLISIEKPPNKPHSLEFKIADGYNTPGITNTSQELEVQQEMNVIITVLNRLFDEDSLLYIGNKSKIIPIHNKINNILNNINIHSVNVSRKNKGSKIIPFNTINPNMNLNENTYKLKKKQNTGYKRGRTIKRK